MQSSSPSRHTRRRRALSGAPRLTGDKLSPAQVASIETRIIETPTCWLWAGSVDNDGYPPVVWLGKRYRVHRLWFEHITGEALPVDLEIDHTCECRRCLLHLEPCTKSENLRRRFARGAAPLPFAWRAARDYSLALSHLDSITQE
jgi:hypothetical protein